MTVTYLLIAVLFLWSVRSIRSLWHAGRGEKLKLSIGDETSMAAFALCAWYLAMKMIG